MYGAAWTWCLWVQNLVSVGADDEKFYEVVESSLHSLSSSSLSALHCAFSMLETLAINLFLLPWKKEFRSIKTYTGPFVYYVKSTLQEKDI
ncbi:hypothetical protein STEG23_023966 [Scotinomys teguina]